MVVQQRQHPVAATIFPTAGGGALSFLACPQQMRQGFAISRGTGHCSVLTNGLRYFGVGALWGLSAGPLRRRRPDLKAAPVRERGASGKASRSNFSNDEGTEIFFLCQPAVLEPQSKEDRPSIDRRG